MEILKSCRIHPTAIVSPQAQLGEGVVIGPFTVIDGPVRIGPRCEIKARVSLQGPLTMGPGNVVYPGAVLGERPQHLKYADEPTRTEIGANNTFRENVTVHRGTAHSWVTRIGDNNFIMAGCHIAHDCVIGNNCTLVNNALIGGHCVLEDNVYISGNSGVHQFVRIGRLALLSGTSATTKHIPPFIIQQGINTVRGVNVVGMRRAGMTMEQIIGVRKAFRLIYRKELTLTDALQRVKAELRDNDAVQEMVAFFNRCKDANEIRHGREKAA